VLRPGDDAGLSYGRFGQMGPHIKIIGEIAQLFNPLNCQMAKSQSEKQTLREGKEEVSGVSGRFTQSPWRKNPNLKGREIWSGVVTGIIDKPVKSRYF
jgi:hypothetical protein